MQPDDELTLKNLWEETRVEPDWMFTSYKNVQEMSKQVGVEVPKHLVPGQPVVITKHGMETYYGD